MSKTTIFVHNFMNQNEAESSWCTMDFYKNIIAQLNATFARFTQYHNMASPPPVNIYDSDDDFKTGAAAKAAADIEERNAVLQSIDEDLKS